MFQKFAFCFGVALVISSTSFAMGKPKPGAFDATAWEGKYQAVDPACLTRVIFAGGRSVHEVMVTVTPEEDGPSIKFEGTPVDPNPRESFAEEFHQLNGKPYISANSCWEDGLIFRDRVKANAAEVQVTTERMGHTPLLCTPNHRVLERFVSFTAGWREGVLTLWDCPFRKL